MFCLHEYVRIKELYDYWDYSGYHVHVFKCRCQKCGKVKNRKFY